MQIIKWGGAILAVAITTISATYVQDYVGRLPLTDLEDRPVWKELNNHAYGVGLRVLLPGTSHELGEDAVVRVVDLGPDVAGMIDDIEPVAAQIVVNGNIAPFIPGANGDLEVRIPSGWLNLFWVNHVELDVWGPNGEVLIRMEGTVPSSL